MFVFSWLLSIGMCGRNIWKRPKKGDFNRWQKWRSRNTGPFIRMSLPPALSILFLIEREKCFMSERSDFTEWNVCFVYCLYRKSLLCNFFHCWRDKLAELRHMRVCLSATPCSHHLWRRELNRFIQLFNKSCC